jgi:prophage DNA circulation protein
MAWKDELRPASFRGVTFFVKALSFTGGRRTVLHEFPEKDDPITEDMGGIAKEFTIDGFVIGDNYTQDRDALIRVLDQYGPGVLIHPTIGELNVAVGRYTVREQTDDGGMAVFTIPFIQDSALNFPQPTTNDVAETQQKCDDIDDSSAESFSEEFSITDAVVSSSILAQTQAMLGEVVGFVGSILGPVAAFAEFVDDVAAGIVNLATELTVLALSPLKLAYAFQTPFQRLSTITSLPSRIRKGYSRPLIPSNNKKKVFTGLDRFIRAAFKATQYNGATNTAGLQKLRQNYIATRLLVGNAAITAMSQVILATDYESTEEAEQDRDLIISYIESQIELTQEFEGAGADDIYSDLADLRFLLYRGMPPEGTQSKDLQTSTLEVPETSLSIAFREYGNLDYEEDLIARNSVRNPALIPSGKSITVLK